MKLPIPEIQRQVTPSGGAGAAMAQPMTFGGVMDAAQSLERAAAQREQVADAQLANFQRLEHEQKQARNVERVSAARLQWTETLIKRQNEAPPGAEGFTPSVLNDFDAWKKQSAQGIKDETERRMFEGMVSTVRDHIGGNALQFETQQRRAYRKRVAMDGIDTDAKTAGFDPSQMTGLVAARVAAIRSIGDFSTEERSALEQNAKESIAFQAANTLVNNDPREWIKRNPKDDPVQMLLDPEKLRHLNDHARALIARDEAHNRSTTDRALNEAEKAVDELTKFVMDGNIVSPEYEVRLRTVTEPFGYMKESVDGLIKQARAGASFGAQPLAVQEQSLSASKAGTPEDAKLIDHARAVHSRQKAAYAEDPWSAAAQFGRVPASPEVEIGSAEELPDLIRQRKATIGQVEFMASQPVSPLRPREVPRAVEKLNGLPVERRAEVLAAMGEQLSVQQIVKMSDQIDKNDRATALMLKAGASRTNAGRSLSVLIGRGANALADKTIKRDDQALIGWKAEISSLIRGAGLGERMEQDAIDMAYFVRAALEAPGYEFDVKSNEKAVELVLGKPYQRGQSKTFLPKGMKENDFIEKAGQGIAAAGDSFFVRGQKMDRAAVLRYLPDMGMERDEQMRYTPFYNGAPVTTDGKTPLRLDIR